LAALVAVSTNLSEPIKTPIRALGESATDSA